jgi:hypothetical protein
MILALGCGYASEKYGLVSPPCMVLLGLLSLNLFALCYLTGVSFVRPTVSGPILLGTIALAVLDWGFDALLNTYVDDDKSRKGIYNLWLVLFLITFRGVCILPPCLRSSAYLILEWGNLAATPSIALSNCIVSAVTPFLMCCAYIADQRMIVVFLPVQLIPTGGTFATTNADLVRIVKDGLLPLPVMVWIGWLILRRRRSLPAGIQEAKFISLRFLRKMLATGISITRCQDLPDEGFGDFGKAQSLVITSHRWLDRYKCDITTDEFPLGLRLTTMVRKLGLKFPTTFPEVFSGSICDAVKLLITAMTSQGDDVLIFFDFMALPQIGSRPDGTLIERTESEAALFQKALPEMGALYTTYPVITLPEVGPGIAPYFCSGWCFCEFIEAVLCKTIGEYSPDAPKLYEEWSKEQSEPPALDLELLNKGINNTFTPSLATEFRNAFLSDLNQKKLFNEDDREVIRGILHGFFLRRLLSDAIDRQDLSDVQKHIAEVSSNGLEAALSHPIDDTLNTLLHKAVGWCGSKEIVAALIDAGADVTAKNIRGDVPSQFLTLPLLSPSASICREAASRVSKDGYNQLLATPANSATL